MRHDVVGVRGRVAWLIVLVVNLSWTGFYDAARSGSGVAGASPPPDVPSVETATNEETETWYEQHVARIELLFMTLFGEPSTPDRLTFRLLEEIDGAGTYPGRQFGIDFEVEVAWDIPWDEEVFRDTAPPDVVADRDRLDAVARAVFATVTTPNGSASMLGFATAMDAPDGTRASELLFVEDWDGTPFWEPDPRPEGDAPCPPIPDDLCDCDEAAINADCCAVYVSEWEQAWDIYDLSAGVAIGKFLAEVVFGLAWWIVSTTRCIGLAAPPLIISCALFGYGALLVGMGLATAMLVAELAAFAHIRDLSIDAARRRFEICARTYCREC